MLAALRCILSVIWVYACELLLSGYYSQEEAAQAAGFSDIKYFRTAFKKRLGRTPSGYLARHRLSAGDLGAPVDGCIHKAGEG